MQSVNATQNFDQVMVLDTNIILLDVTNVEILSQQSSNLIVIPETVMDELDNKKSGFDSINFQARAFGRLLEKAEIKFVKHFDNYTISRMFINSNKNITVDVISKKKYEFAENVDKNILNDRKIIDIASLCEEIYEDTVVKFISNDVMCRLRAISLGLKTEALGKDFKEDIELYQEFDADVEKLPSYFESDELGIGNTIFGIGLNNSNGEQKYYYRSGKSFFEIDEKLLEKQNIKPKNIEQKIFSSLILDNKHDLYICDAKAGTGKTAIALSAAIELIDQKMSSFDKIVYIRKTIISSDVDLGYLPGSLEEKMAGYLAPLYSTLEAIAMRKYNKKKMTDEESVTLIADLIKKYRITPMWQGHLRGATIRNAIVIYDENQNDSIGDLKTTLSRFGENTIGILLGCTDQIDAKHINKFNNALTYMMNKIGEESNIRIAGFRLQKSVRSEIAEWTDTIKGN